MNVKDLLAMAAIPRIGTNYNRERGENEEGVGLERFQRRSKGIKGRRSIFADRKFHGLGRALPGPQGEGNRKGQRDGGRTETKTGAILLDQAMEHGLHAAPNSGAIRR